MLESLGLLQHAVHDLVRIQRLAVVDLDQHLVLEFQCGMNLLAQRFLVENVGDPDPDARHLVLIAGADAAAGGANLLGSQIPFGHLVDRDVVRHQQMRIRGQDEARGIDPPLFQARELGQQHAGVDDDTVADDVGHPG